jgi:hypothetical protein
LKIELTYIIKLVYLNSSENYDTAKILSALHPKARLSGGLPTVRQNRKPLSCFQSFGCLLAADAGFYRLIGRFGPHSGQSNEQQRGADGS